MLPAPHPPCDPPPLLLVERQVPVPGPHPPPVAVIVPATEISPLITKASDADVPEVDITPPEATKTGPKTINVKDPEIVIEPPAAILKDNKRAVIELLPSVPAVDETIDELLEIVTFRALPPSVPAHVRGVVKVVTGGIINVEPAAIEIDEICNIFSWLAKVVHNSDFSLRDVYFALVVEEIKDPEDFTVSTLSPDTVSESAKDVLQP